ncbi:Rho family-interacting cell polarization regulator 1 [Larimichthys crocea]|uniref:Uncharacterized protein n=1 Tax=Larimichthys crocea TaxID=215358 RepID=A0ACD3QDQ6_LARCR|nr:Rho family-interacting cell polarization regulator 1 [Larimichthys crocea]
MKESKRNSRLGFLYELDKQVKVTERYIRRLEFHLSKIDELYEAYCLQRRLRDGADKMVKAYTASPGSKEARESLTEANKGYKEYTENMCVLESELENQLGEFHIKMKGLAGFARLCAGDQYEIFMKYGRQRWKLRGRIEINAKQVWDSEDMVFLPLISEFLSVKVTELKSLANHVVVGSVSCETKDLFAALPQTVAVDINDLGTIKLSLEVTWNPFDKDDQGSLSSTVNKAPTVNKRFSTIFNQSPPDTPSLREQAFYNMLRRHEELENGAAWSNSSESSDDSSSPQMSVGGLRNSTHKPDISFCPRDSSSSSPNSSSKVSEVAKHQTESDREEEKGAVTEPNSEDKDAGEQSPIATGDGVVSTSRSYLRSLSHISESSADGIMLTDRSAGESGEVMSLASGLSINDIEMEIPSRTPEPPTCAASDADLSLTRLCVVKENTSTDEVTDQHPNIKKLATSSSVVTPPPPRTEGVDPSTVSQMNTQLDGDTHSESGDLMYIARRVSVEEDLPGAGADCLSTEGGGPVDSGLEDALGTVVSSLDDYRGQFPELQLLEQELKLLQATLKRLGTFGPLRCGEMYALDRLLREVQVLENIRRVTKDNPRRLRQPAEVIPQLGLCLGAVSLWQQCMGQGSVYRVSAESFLATLSTVYSRMLPERSSNMADKVFLCLVERILDQRLPRRGSSRDSVMVTLFQLWTYLEANGISDMETHITELAEEVWLVHSLESCDQDVIVHALRRPAESSLRREGLHAVAKLLKDPRGKISASASSVLRSLTAQPRQREQALVSCLELLEDENMDTRVCGCKALACLKAKESIEQLVYICRTDKEEVRDAAKQALLVLGEEGKMAHRHVETSQDSIPRLFAPGSMASTAF